MARWTPDPTFRPFARAAMNALRPGRKAMQRLARLLAVLAVVAMVYPVPAASGREAWAPAPTATATPAPTATAPGKSSKFAVSPNKAAKLSFAGAALDIPAGAVPTQTTITIAALSSTELATALDKGMANATMGPQAAYRFLPHNMHFARKIKVSVPYDETLIPAGFTEQDLRTYFFDTEMGQWQILDRVAVDTANRLIVSSTDHFTDMINGVVTVPDHPGTQSLDPNSMAGIKAANPSAAIDLVEPPQAGGSGDARLSHPTEVPPGRNGVQPHLALTYDSSGGDGLVGLGWDLALSGIAIDTRWGVPRYDTGKETETYLLDGEQLTPLAHRGDTPPRLAERAFHTRAEREFRKIIRHGTGPANYWWEVTDKDGTRSFYGGDPDSQALDPQAVVADPSSGNVFRWMLRELRDTHGNSVRYRYDVVGGDRGGEPWRQIYPSSARYTGTSATEGPYEVVFSREAARPDVMVDGRPGFMTVLADRLTGIDVRFDGQVVRSYRLEYRTGEFAKSLLSAVALRGLGGDQEMYRHTFEYFDMDRSGDTLAAFDPAKVFNAPPSVVRAGDGLSRSDDSLTGGGASIGVGIGPVKLTGGGGLFDGDESTRHAFVDPAGKDLPGFVDDQGNALVSTLVPSPSGSAASFDPVAVPGVPEDGLGHADRSGWNVEGYLSLGFFTGGANYTRNSVQDDHVLADMDGDGLSDLVSVEDGCVKVQLNDAGRAFRPYRNPDDGSACWGNADVTGLSPSHPDRMDAAKQALFLVDPFVRWTAPIDGTVTITGAVQKSAGGGDGVTAEIFHGGALLWRRTFAAGDLSPCAPSGADGCNGAALSVPVAAGDRLYFKAGSIDDTTKDDLLWSPTVTYQVASSLLPLREPHGPFVYRYSQQEDHRLAGRPSVQWVAAAEGTVRVRGFLTKQTTSDDVLFRVEKLPGPFGGGGGVLLSQTQSADSTTQGTVPFDVPQDIPVARGDRLTFRATSDAPFDPDRARWDVQVEYTTFCRPEPGASPVCGPVVSTTLPTGRVVYRIQGDPDPELTLPPAVVVQRPPVRYPVFVWRSPESAPQEATKVLPAPRPGTLQGTGTLLGDSLVPSQATVLVQGVHRLFYKQTFAVSLLVPQTFQLTVDAAQDDELVFTVLTATDSGTTLKLTVDGTDQTAAVNRRHPDPASLYDDDSDTVPADPMSGGYHNWSAGDWKGSLPFDPSQIVFPATSPVDPTPDPSRPFGLALPLPHGTPGLPLALWAGRGFDGYVAAGRMKPSRLASVSGGLASDGPDQLRTASAWNLRVGAGATVRGVKLGANVSIGDASTELDLVDFNGDGYPDVVSAGTVRFNDGRGAFSAAAVPGLGVDGSLRETVNRDVGANAGTGKSFNLTDGEGKTSKILATEVEAGLDYGLSSSRLDLVDVNGDGLPDQVRTDGDRVLVRLNLGYRLAREIEWPRGTPWANGWVAEGGLGGDVLKLAFEDDVDADGSLRLQDTGSNNVGFGGKFNIGIVEVGAGAGLTFSIARSYTDLVDVNGDGLPDQVMRLPGEGYLRVKLNLGDRFDDERLWAVPNGWGVPIDDRNYTFFSTADALGYRRSRDFVVSGSVGACFGICVGGSAFHSTGFGSSHMGLEDVDGDGKADFVLKKSGDANLRVKLSRIGKTNLLKTVRRPLGAVVDLDYARAGNTTDQPHNRWVLSRVNLFDGFAGDGDDTQLTTDRYEGGVYDRLEREFYGFRRVTEEDRDPAHGDALRRATVREYRTDGFYTQGLPARELTQDGAGKPFIETENTYVLRDVTTGVEPADGRSTTATLFAQLVRADHRFYEGNPTPGKSTYTTHRYDEHGNVVQFLDAGEVGDQDDVQATIEYSPCVDSHVLQPTRTTVVGNGRPMRQREATVDCATGEVRQVRQYLDSSTYAATDLAYFRNGNLKPVTMPPNKSGQRYQLTYDYDPVVQTHVARVTDSFGYASTAAHDLRFGGLETSVDTNNNATSYAYDAFGRVVSITAPYQQGGSTPTISFEYHHDAAVPWALTKHLDNFRGPAATIDTVLFTDGLERVLQTKKTATTHAGPDSPARDVMVVSGRLTFDSLGRTV